MTIFFFNFTLSYQFLSFGYQYSNVPNSFANTIQVHSPGKYSGNDKKIVWTIIKTKTRKTRRISLSFSFLWNFIEFIYKESYHVETGTRYPYAKQERHQILTDIPKQMQEICGEKKHLTAKVPTQVLNKRAGPNKQDKRALNLLLNPYKRPQQY